MTEETNVPWAWVRAVRDILSKAPYESEEQPVELLPWLYLCDWRCVSAFDPIQGSGRILETGITHVLTTCRMPGVEKLRNRLASAGIEYMAVMGRDEERYDMIGQHWEECYSFIRSVRDKEDKKIIVHCLAGQNRSGLLAAAAMMVLERRHLLDVVRHIKAKRGVVLTNLSFQKQLCLLAQNEGLLGDKPKGYSDEPVEYLY